MGGQQRLSCEVLPPEQMNQAMRVVLLSAPSLSLQGFTGIAMFLLPCFYLFSFFKSQGEFRDILSSKM